MKVILEFDSLEEAEPYLQGPKALNALGDLSEKFRALDKYDERETISISQVREMINDSIGELELY